LLGPLGIRPGVYTRCTLSYNEKFKNGVSCSICRFCLNVQYYYRVDYYILQSRKLNSKRVMLGSLWDVVLLTFGVLHLNGRVLHFNFKTVIRLVDLPCSAITLLCNYLALQLPRSSHAASAVGRSLSSHHRPTLFSTLQLRTDPTLHFVLSFFRP
jgi:hypothetical protein